MGRKWKPKLEGIVCVGVCTKETDNVYIYTRNEHYQWQSMPWIANIKIRELKSAVIFTQQNSPLVPQ